MPKRVLDFDAMWGSDKLAACAEWAQGEYAWLYGLADASGSFEMTNIRVIWGRVAAIRHNLSIERLAQVFDEFHDKGLLFLWDENGKRYGHWTGSDVPGRLPAPSWRMRLEKLAPPVPKQQLAEYMSRFARGRANCRGGEFQSSGNGEKFKTLLNPRIEEDQAQDWDRNKKRDWRGVSSDTVQGTEEMQKQHPLFVNQSEHPQNRQADAHSSSAHESDETTPARVSAPLRNEPAAAAPMKCSPPWRGAVSEKAVAAAREARVGQGPACSGVRVKREVLERVRSREESRRAVGNAVRAP